MPDGRLKQRTDKTLRSAELQRDTDSKINEQIKTNRIGGPQNKWHIIKQKFINED